jgi:putative endonuclease
MWVYILRCNDDSLYVGVTTDLATRIEQHQAGVGASYTARRRQIALAYSEEVSDRADAIARERQLKRWSAQKKRALIRGELNTLRQLAKRRTPKRVS